MISVKTLVLHDWRLLSREGLFRWPVLLLLLAASYAVLDGRNIMLQRKNAAGRLATAEWQRMEKERAVARRLFHPADPPGTVPPYGPLHAMYVRNFAWFSAILPGAPLGALCRGSDDLTPSSYQVTLPENTRTFKTTESTASPLQMLMGPFDVAFVILAIYSLVVIASSHSLLAFEYESGLMGLIRSNPVSACRYISSRVLSRSLLVAVMAASLGAISVIGAAGLTSVSQWSVRVGVWFGITLLYGLLWVAIATSINAVSHSSLRNFTILGGLWLLFVILIPASLRFMAARIYPVAPRVEFVEAIRLGPQQFLAQTAGLRADFLNAHPEYRRDPPYPQLGNSQVSSVARSERFARALDEMAVRFDGQRQKQITFVESWAWLSPALLVELALETSAGTGADRQEMFRRQMDEYRKTLQAFFWPRIFEEAVFRPSDYDQIPRFQFQEEKRERVLQRVSPLLIDLSVWILIASVLPLVLIVRRRPL